LADFDVRVISGVTIDRWTDPASSTGKPSRVRSRPGRPQLYWKGKAGQVIVLQAVVNGFVAPPDSGLGGRLFSPYLPEGFGPPYFAATANFSSIVRWTPTSPGHHVVGIRRTNGGAMLLHFDIEA
jgi:hypothetical protein